MLNITPMTTVTDSGSVPTKIITARRDSARQYANPLKMAQNLWVYRELIGQFTKREVQSRYKGSSLGLFWSFITPLLMLTIYTFVFSVIFKGRWGNDLSDSSRVGFALTLYTGLIAFGVFSECLVRAPGLIISHPNYVKKVIFPLEILPVSVLGSALINSLFSLVILLLALLVFQQPIHWTLIFLPLMYLPLMLLCLGLSWFLASLSVFIRDVGQLIGFVVQVLFFMTPIIYPISAVPAGLQFILYLNPLTFIVNHFRRVILWGQMPDWGEFVLVTISTGVICILGYIWFMKSKKTFADVV
jgi:lipopolysaccharide transport system permease protein